MTLSSGTLLGPYEVVGPLGAGGMGEVYRAQDARLGREVALKVLPADVSSDPERLKRFEEEARSASSLNHPTSSLAPLIGLTNRVDSLHLLLAFRRDVKSPGKMGAGSLTRNLFLLIGRIWRPPDW